MLHSPAPASAPWYAALAPLPDWPDPGTGEDPNLSRDALLGDNSIAYDRMTAYRGLLAARLFTDDWIGGGVLSPHAKAFRTLLAEPEAPAVFRDLLARGSPSGQLYALCGLWLTDRPALYSILAPFRSDTREVTTMIGCVPSVQRIGRLVTMQSLLAADPQFGLAEWAMKLAGRGGRDRSSYYVEVPNLEYETKAMHEYQGQCTRHGVLTNASTNGDKVREVVEAHNRGFHSGEVPPAFVNRLR